MKIQKNKKDTEKKAYELARHNWNSCIDQQKKKENQTFSSPQKISGFGVTRNKIIPVFRKSHGTWPKPITTLRGGASPSREKNKEDKNKMEENRAEEKTDEGDTTKNSGVSEPEKPHDHNTRKLPKKTHRESVYDYSGFYEMDTSKEDISSGEDSDGDKSFKIELKKIKIFDATTFKGAKPCKQRTTDKQNTKDDNQPPVQTSPPVTALISKLNLKKADMKQKKQQVDIQLASLVIHRWAKKNKRKLDHRLNLSHFKEVVELYGKHGECVVNTTAVTLKKTWEENTCSPDTKIHNECLFCDDAIWENADDSTLNELVLGGDFLEATHTDAIHQTQDEITRSDNLEGETIDIAGATKPSVDPSSLQSQGNVCSVESQQEIDDLNWSLDLDVSESLKKDKENQILKEKILLLEKELNNLRPKKEDEETLILNEKESEYEDRDKDEDKNKEREMREYCTICTANYKDHSKLVAHYKDKHPQIDNIPAPTFEHGCNYCGRLFKMRSTLTNHIKMTHKKVSVVSFFLLFFLCLLLKVDFQTCSIFSI